MKEEVKELLSTPGETEARFLKEYNEATETYKGIQVLNEGMEAFEADKKNYLEAFLKELDDPELTLPEPIHVARRQLFDYEDWPEEYNAEYFKPLLETVCKHYEYIFELWFGDLHWQ